MGLKQCVKCEEMVDEAKAFCPGCGNAFVEERAREEATGFDKMDSTVQFGQTMYNQMLSDMGLSSAKAAKVPDKHVEVLQPEPAASVVPKPRPEVKPKPSGNLKWYILGGVFLVLILVLFIAALVVLWYFWPRLR